MRNLNDIFDFSDAVMIGSRVNDSITSLNGSDTIFAGRGDDSIVIGDREGFVTVLGGRGDDSILIIGQADAAEIEQRGKVTIITTDEGMTLVVRGVEHIDWSF